MTTLSANQPAYQRHVAPSNDPNVGQAERIASSVAGGALLLLAIRERGLVGGALAALGAACLWHGSRRHSPVYAALGVQSDDASTWSNPISRDIHSRWSVTIDRSPQELFETWRELSNLPRFLTHVESVEEQDDKISHWTARIPGGKTAEWDARITQEDRPHTIRWESLEGADFDHRGQITFRPAFAGRGTVVALEMKYHLPAGLVGVLFAKAKGVDPQHEAAEALRRLKQWAETGECTTNARQTEDHKHPTRSHAQQEERVEEALQESFPASDPPAHTGTTASPSSERSERR